MDISVVVTIFLIGLMGSFLSGMLGIGGSIINYPMLLYVPVLVGVGQFSAHEVTEITIVQVFFSTLAGILVYRKSGYINKDLILYMGISILLGSFIGGFVSNQMSELGINLVYGILASMAVIMMFFPKKDVDEIPLEQMTFNKSLSALSAFIVGIGSGIVGAGGSFLLVPIMLVVLKIPTRVTIASSLVITFISSVGSMFGKFPSGQFQILPILIMVITCLIATPIGAKVGQKTNTKILQTVLAFLILITAIKSWMGIF